MPRLYRDDLEEIERIIQTGLKPVIYGLAYNGKRYDGLAQIPETPAVTHTFVFYTQGPSLRLKLARSWAELYIGETGPGIDEAVRAIVGCLRRAERARLWLWLKFAPALAPLLGFSSVATLVILVKAESIGIRWLWSVPGILLATAVWWILGHYYCHYLFSLVHLQARRSNARRESPN